MMSEGIPGETTSNLQVLVTETLYAPEEVPGPVAVVIEGTTIKAIWRATDAEAARQLVNEYLPGASMTLTDLGAWRLAPGFIDIHTHGFAGYDITSGSSDDIAAIAQKLPMTGVTAFFPTVATTGKTETAQQVERVVTCIERYHTDAAAEVLGIRLEGPFISREKKGAQYEPAIRQPDSVEIAVLAKLARGWIKLLDFAPEEDEDSRFLATLLQLGILPCIGHTSASYEQALHAIDNGACHSTHLFNAMSALSHRAPGVPGALLTDKRATVEVIADGIHVHSALLRLAVAARGPEAVALITDAVTAAGLPDGEYDFTGRKVQVVQGAVRLSDGTLAGSTLTLDRAVRNMVAFAGVTWSEAIRMATLTPARIAGVDGRKGKLVPAADADLVALDDGGNVKYAWTRGRLAYCYE
jgi:N-acetylglucosamine-6-phosphate deacetylase